MAMADLSISGSFSGGMVRESLHLLLEGAAGVMVKETGQRPRTQTG